MEQSLATTSAERQPDVHSTESSTILKKWLALFSEHHGKPISELSALAYVRGLGDLTDEQIDRACEQCLKVCRFMPTVADIRGQIDRAEELDLESEAEDAWQGLLDSIAKNYIPDIGRSPHLAWDVEHAARAAGGLSYLESCPRSELVWARKRFIEDFMRIQKTGQAEHLLLSQRGVERLLAQVSKVSAPKSAKPLSAAPESALPPRRETAKAKRAVVNKIIRPMPVPPSEEEIARRKVEQKQRLEDWLRTRSQLASAEVSKG